MDYSQFIKKTKIVGPDDELDFGKWKGATIEKIMEEEVSYITWCIEEGIFELDQDAEKLYDEYSLYEEDQKEDFFNNYY